MVGLGIVEIIILLVMGLGCIGFVALVVVLALVGGRRTAETIREPAPIQQQPRQTPVNQAADSHVEIVARLTQRFCPQCRVPLPADSPEGLCPACLLAGAMGEGPNGSAAPAHGDAVTTPPSGSRPPLDGEIGDLQRHFPQLEILELLGRGGMGAVYKVRQKNLDRLVAIKVIPPAAAKDPAFAERFAREARAMARLNHPSIVTVYDYGETNGVFWLLMEYIDGVNLRQTLQGGHLSPRETLAIVPPICDALQYAHDQGVVHRDIKPENVLLDRSGRVKIADFGLAKLLGKGPDDFKLTHTRQVMGTPRYMAPEQIERPTSVDHRADIYSLGVVIYEMLTGELPLGRFAPPSERAELDVRIDQVVLRALEKEPDRRYQRASQVKTELASASSSAFTAADGRNYSRGAPLAEEGPGVRGAQPSWHTPAYATKSDGLTPPAGVPLGMVLAVAFGMVLGVLMMGGGVAILAYGLWFSFRALGDGNAGGVAWGYFGAAFGCIAGGFGSAAGSYNSYRQLAGAEDLMRSPRTTWFDWVMRVYMVIGITLLMAGAALSDGANSWEPFVTLGAIATFQASLFLILRALMRTPALPTVARSPLPPSDPRLQSIRRRVAGPAIGLMIVGLLGFFPLCLGLVAVPFFVIMPVSDEVQRGDSPWDEKSGPMPVYEDTIEAKHSWHVPIPMAIAWAFPAASLPVMLAQARDTTALIPTWIFLIAVILPLNLVFSLTLIIGGWRMNQLKSYGLAMIATVLAMLPCTMGWFLGLPIGLWSLLTLMQPEVKEAFES